MQNPPAMPSGQITESPAMMIQSYVSVQGASIYVAGSAIKLAQSVLRTLEQAVAEAAPMPSAAAQKYIRQLEAGRRYFVEAW